ncbi:MAG: hypothetical protein Q4F79_00225 [Eubacteriales bacterium]|nr:hypothetical protein [Eubacteriales bacterium]
MTREMKKAEALERMKMLKLHSNVINEFQNQDKVNLSENGGFLYWLNDDQKRRVAEFEKKYDALVYHVIRNITKFGELLSYLYVSDSEEEWEMDREDLRNGTALVYVENLNDKWCSEFGSIGIQPSLGGLLRTA